MTWFKVISILTAALIFSQFSQASEAAKTLSQQVHENCSDEALSMKSRSVEVAHDISSANPRMESAQDTLEGLINGVNTKEEFKEARAKAVSGITLVTYQKASCLHGIVKSELSKVQGSAKKLEEIARELEKYSNVVNTQVEYAMGDCMYHGDAPQQKVCRTLVLEDQLGNARMVKAIWDMNAQIKKDKSLSFHSFSNKYLADQRALIGRLNKSNLAGAPAGPADAQAINVRAAEGIKAKDARQGMTTNERASEPLKVKDDARTLR